MRVRGWSWLLTGVLLVGLVGAPGPAAAQAVHPVSDPGGGPIQQAPRLERPYRGGELRWDPRYGSVGLRDYALFGAGLSLTLAKFAIGPSDSVRRGGVWVDEDVRDALRLESIGAQRFARDTSDVLLTALSSYPFFDSVLIAGWYRGSPEVARELSWINAETMAITTGFQAIANVVASRERPYGRNCGIDRPEDGRDCDSNNRYFSFFSGHATQAFTAAGLTCIHHIYLPLYGGGLADGMACGVSMLFAAATATLRVAGDMHYLTDVAMGALIGTIGGMGIPWLLFYRHGSPQRLRSTANPENHLYVMPAPQGVQFGGTFE